MDWSRRRICNPGGNIIDEAPLAGVDLAVGSMAYEGNLPPVTEYLFHGSAERIQSSGKKHYLIHMDTGVYPKIEVVVNGRRIAQAGKNDLKGIAGKIVQRPA
jgi:hypothetical protein